MNEMCDRPGDGYKWGMYKLATGGDGDYPQTITRRSGGQERRFLLGLMLLKLGCWVLLLLGAAFEGFNEILCLENCCKESSGAWTTGKKAAGCCAGLGCWEASCCRNCLDFIVYCSNKFIESIEYSSHNDGCRFISWVDW